MRRSAGGRRRKGLPGALPGVEHLGRWDADALRVMLQAWLGSRGLILLVGLLVALSTGRSVTDLVANWDVQHFIGVAEHGYLRDPKTMAFFPGWPLVLRAGMALGVAPTVTGVALSLVLSLVAAAALVRMGGPWAAVGWLFAPVAVFTAVPYTESAFCAAAFWAWQRASADRWGSAALLTALACTTRVSGLFLVGALAVMVLTWPGLDVPGRVRRWAWLLLPTAVLAGYVVYLWTLTGSWTAWSDAQAAGWARGFHWPWESALNTWPVIRGDYVDHPDWTWVFRGEAVSMLMGLVVTGWCLSRRMWAEASWVGVQVLAFSVSYWWFSVNRAVLLWFPLWLMFAHLVSVEPKRPAAQALRHTVLVGWLLLSGLATLVWTWLFTTGQWSS
nr:mannosyltransferase family protein [Auraticoccus monumenti]